MGATDLPVWQISVIVPVYNVRDYLPSCVDSILRQDAAELECILVDDGSTDGSGALCDELARTDPRIRVVHKPNGGLSDARNAGLDAARGAYVAFVDSDDRLAPSALEALKNGMETDSLDVAVGNVMLHDMRSGEERPFAPLSTPRPQGLMDRLFNVSACNKLYRREVFANRRFEKGIKFEDVPVWADILFSGARIGFVDATVYVYNVNREGSIVTLRDYRGYPSAWESQREAMRAHGVYDAANAAAFVARIALKFIQAFNLSGAETRREFYLRTQRFFRGCGRVGPSRECGGIAALAAYAHYLACTFLPYRAYRVLTAPETVIAHPRINAWLRRRYRQGKGRG